jgi:hypothetical protein
VSLLLRFRRARGTERLQLRWVAMTAELLALTDQTVQPTAASLWLRPAPRR